MYGIVSSRLRVAATAATQGTWTAQRSTASSATKLRCSATQKRSVRGGARFYGGPAAESQSAGSKPQAVSRNTQTTVPPSPPDTRLGPPDTGGHMGVQPWWTNRGPITWAGLGIVMGIGGSLTFAFKYFEMKIAEDRFRSVGTAKLGGPFQLIDTDGKPFSDKDLLGKWALLYFGFTTCPDICPAELHKINSALTTIDQSIWIGPVIQPVLITVDPKRDTPCKMKKYIEQFHPRTIGLTGTAEQIKVAARAYRVYFNPTDDDDEHYLIDHSIISYLINPDGKFVAFYGQTVDADTMAEKISEHIWEAKKRAFWQSLGLLEVDSNSNDEGQENNAAKAVAS